MTSRDLLTMDRTSVEAALMAKRLEAEGYPFDETSIFLRQLLEYETFLRGCGLVNPLPHFCRILSIIFHDTVSAHATKTEEV